MAAPATKPIGNACLAGAVSVAIIGTALALSACGSSSKPTASAPYGPKSSPVALSKCMRANGLSNFPDPSAGPGGGVGFNGLGISNNGTLIVDGTTFAGPATARAETACKIYLPPGGPPPQMSAAQKAKLLTFARCMRANGVPSFPDPTFGAAAAQKIAGGPNSIDPQAPAFRHAVQACGGHGNVVAVSAP